MWWKVYFFILIILSILGLITVLQDAPLGFVDLIDLIGMAVMILALYSFIYKKKILSKENWKIIFWIIIVLTATDLINIYFLPVNLLEDTFPFLARSVAYNPEDFVLGAIISIPAYYSIYQLSKK